MSEDHRSCDKFMPLEIASNNAKTSSLFDDISLGMKQVHLTLKTASYAKSIFTIYTPLGSRNVFVDSGTWITPGI
jgi:hypothetical protein